LEGREAFRKISFVKRVPDMDYFICAGVYSDLPMDEVIRQVK
jgi:hypothetical protein